MFAEQLAVLLPSEPAQIQFHGPEPDTAEAEPASQRLAVGATVKVCPFALPHAPFAEAGRHDVLTWNGAVSLEAKLIQPIFSPQALPLKTPAPSIDTPPPVGEKLIHPVFSPQA